MVYALLISLLLGLCTIFSNCYISHRFLFQLCDRRRSATDQGQQHGKQERYGYRYDYNTSTSCSGRKSKIELHESGLQRNPLVHTTPAKLHNASLTRSPCVVSEGLDMRTNVNGSMDRMNLMLYVRSKRSVDSLAREVLQDLDDWLEVRGNHRLRLSLGLGDLWHNRLFLCRSVRRRS